MVGSQGSLRRESRRERATEANRIVCDSTNIIPSQGDEGLRASKIVIRRDSAESLKSYQFFINIRWTRIQTTQMTRFAFGELS